MEEKPQQNSQLEASVEVNLTEQKVEENSQTKKTENIEPETKIIEAEEKVVESKIEQTVKEHELVEEKKNKINIIAQETITSSTKEKVNTNVEQNQRQLKEVFIQQRKHEQKIVNNETQQTTLQQNQTLQIKLQMKGEIGERIQKQEVDRHAINLQVIESVQKGTSLSKYMVYRIVGDDKHGRFSIYRKYTQFQSLRRILYERWPGSFIPAISNKSDIKKSEEKQRHVRVILTNFLLGLSYSDHLYYREEVQLFLRSPDIQITEMVEQMPVLKTRDVISRLKSSFGEQIEGSSEPAYAAFIKGFTTSLRKIINNLGSLSNKALTLSESYEHYAQSVSKFGEYQRIYECLSLSEFTNNERQKTIITKDSQNRIQKLRELSKVNPFYKLYSFLNNEARDAEAFLEVIIASELFVLRRDELDLEIKDLQQNIDQIALGHKTMKTMTSRKPKEEIQAELEIHQKKLIDQRHTIVEMFKILEILLAKKEIALFKKFKRDNYCSILKEWANTVGDLHPELQAIWQFVRTESKSFLK